MRSRLFIVVLMAATCAACTVTPTALSPSLDGLRDTGYERQLADDAGQQLQTLLPPASTRLVLQPGAVPSGLAAAMTTALRSAGYALDERSAERSSGAPAEEAPTHPAEGNGPAGIQVRYVLDKVQQTDMYYLSLVAGRHRLGRAYLLQQGALHPAGTWVRGEKP